MKIQPHENLAKSPEKAPMDRAKEQLKAVGDSFESIFVNQMITAMRNTVDEEGIMPRSHAEKVYQNLLDTEYAKAISSSGQLGLGEAIQEQLLRDAAER